MQNRPESIQNDIKTEEENREGALALNPTVAPNIVARAKARVATAISNLSDLSSSIRSSSYNGLVWSMTKAKDLLSKVANEFGKDIKRHGLIYLATVVARLLSTNVVAAVVLGVTFAADLIRNRFKQSNFKKYLAKDEAQLDVLSAEQVSAFQEGVRKGQMNALLPSFSLNSFRHGNAYLAGAAAGESLDDSAIELITNVKSRDKKSMI